MFGKNRHLRAAQRAHERGDASGAIDAYERFLEREPGDTKVLRQVAELCADEGRTREAVAHYEALVGALVGLGMGLKAIAACRGLLAIDPTHEATQRSLARLAKSRSVVITDAMTPAMQRGIQPPPPPDDDDDEDDDAIDADDLLVAEQDLEEEADEATGVQLPDIPLFGELSQGAFADLVTRLELWRVPSGAEIVKENERGDSFFVVVSGGVRIDRMESGEQATVGTLGAGEFFGEIAALAGLPRTASVFATRPTELLEVTRAQLDEIRASHPPVENVLRRYLRKRLIANAMAAPVFAGLGDAARGEIVRAFRTVNRGMGSAVLSEGEPTDGLYVVLAGSLEVARGSQTVTELSAGGIFGEIGLFYDEPASASVTALSEVQLLRLSRKSFAKFCERHPTLAARLEELSAARKRSNLRA